MHITFFVLLVNYKITVIYENKTIIIIFLWVLCYYLDYFLKNVDLNGVFKFLFKWFKWFRCLFNRKFFSGF